MHLTGGQFKGRKISTPTGYICPVKPTLSKVRESVFNILNSYFSAFKGEEQNENLDGTDFTGVLQGGGNVFSNLSFLDMFTGSGIMALEAYSRGFGEVFAIEKQPSVFCAVKKMYKDFGAEISLFKGDSLKLIEKIAGNKNIAQISDANITKEAAPQRGFDVIYIDPPWDFDYAPIVSIALKYLSKNGVIITECNKKGANQSCQFLGTEILPFREKIYGRCKLEFIRLP